MKKFGIIACICFALICGKSIAQQGSGESWFSLYVNVPMINTNSDVMELYGCDAQFVNSIGWGLELGYNFNNKLSMFLDGAMENSFDIEKDGNHLNMSTDAASLNLMYALWKNEAKRFSINLRLGFGFYNTKIDYAREIVGDIKPYNEIVRQDYNLYLPVGLSFRFWDTGRNSLHADLVYRQSFDTGTTKYFGVDNEISNMPCNKLSALSLNIGWSVKF